jgi:hypothetical protein
MKKITAALAMISAIIFSSASHASLIVESGFDLFSTTGPTNFAGVDFTGFGFNYFDFGSGSEYVGNTDTIIERTEDAEVLVGGQTDTISIEMAALSLVSTEIVNMGAGLDYYYVTLSESIASLGTMGIMFSDEDGGSFSSSIDVNFDLRIGAIDGAIVLSDELTLTLDSASWGRVPPPKPS